MRAMLGDACDGGGRDVHDVGRMSIRSSLLLS